MLPVTTGAPVGWETGTASGAQDSPVPGRSQRVRTSEISVVVLLFVVNDKWHVCLQDVEEVFSSPSTH